jgi:hypothetical protein
MSKIRKKLREWNGIFCHGMVCRTNALRDAMIISIVLITSGGIMAYSSRFSAQNQKNAEQPAAQIQQSTEQESVQKEEKSVAEIVFSIDTSAWVPYQNTWYGLALKYPQDWADPVIKKPIAGANWEQQIQFRIKQTDEKNPFEGFDVVIYSMAKIKEATKTDEYPKLKNSELGSDPACAMIEGHLLETGEYPAEEIYIPANDACFNATLYFGNTRGDYIYDLVPRIKEGAGLAGDPAQEIATHMPEFLAAAATLNFIDIVRPKPVPPKPKITAPMPFIYKIDSQGRRVCNKKNDKPAKSNQHKGKHMDMECCLDPDEYPNPWCYYPKDKYGKYL